MRSRFGILRQSGRNTEKVLVLHFDHQVHSYMKEQVSAHKQLAGGVEFVQVGLLSLLKLLLSVLIKLLSDQHQDINCISPSLNQYIEKSDKSPTHISSQTQAIPKSAAGKILRKELAAAWKAKSI